jgi:signal transduction histidine kinase/ActR/RegA family two-component response regulator
MSLRGVRQGNSRARATSGFIILVLLALLALAIFAITLSNTITNNVLANEIKENSARTDTMHAGVDNILTTEDFAEINTADDMSSQLYQSLREHLNEIRSLNDARYFYTAKRTDDGTLVYVIDGIDPSADDARAPGDAIEAEMTSYISRALDGETVYSQDIVDTDWGHIFTACYPVHASGSDEIVGALCIETDMESTYEFIYEQQRMLRNFTIAAAGIMVALMACAFAFIRHYRTKDEEDQRKLLASYDKLEAALARETKHSEIISAIATLYTTIFIVNLKTREYEVVVSVELMDNVAGSGGYNIDDAMKGILEAFIIPEMRSSMSSFLNIDTLAGRMGTDNTLSTEYKDPNGRWFQARFIAKKRDEDGRPTEVLYVARDITDEKKREFDLRDRLEDAALEAKRANSSKTNFLRRMSHDIRTPLNGIIGMLRIQDRYLDDPAKLQESKEKMIHSADYLLDLVNNVLDISKLESGALELEHKPFDIVEVLMKSFTVAETSAQENGIELLGGPSESNVRHRNLIGSPTHLNRILMNLVSNGIKYNRKGGWVRASVTEIASDHNTATYRFICEDNGLGMSEEFKARAFDPFSQEGKQTTTSFTGSGLGLSIVKDIIEMMNGTIKLESEENVGTKFTIEIPFEIDHDAEDSVSAPAESTKVDLLGKCILLVEDNELNMEIARMLLGEEGAIITEATNGKEAVDTFNASEMYHFDYILMDMMMPVMDGISATRTIRALERDDAKTTPIIAMTANAFAEDRKECLEAGMNEHISKPIDIETIKETLGKL